MKKYYCNFFNMEDTTKVEPYHTCLYNDICDEMIQMIESWQLVVNEYANPSINIGLIELDFIGPSLQSERDKFALKLAEQFSLEFEKEKPQNFNDFTKVTKQKDEVADKENESLLFNFTHEDVPNKIQDANSLWQQAIASLKAGTFASGQAINKSIGGSTP